MIWLITGLMASGKSTIGDLLARRFDRAVHLRGDIFRKMVVAGREEMSSSPSPEALAQYTLRCRLAADTAKAYHQHGFQVVLQDNYYGSWLPHMLDMLRPCPVRAVVLCPDADALRRREAGRRKDGYRQFDLEALHQSFMAQTPRLGLWLDTSQLTAEQTVDRILADTQNP